MERLHNLRIFRHSYVDPSEFYAYLIDITNTACKIIGLDVFSPGYTLRTYRFYYIVVLTIFYIYVDVSTAWEMRHEPENFINCLVTIGIAFQLAGKFGTFACFQTELVWMHNYVKDLYQKESLSEKKAMIMNNVVLLNIFIKTMLTCYAFTGVALVVVPLFFLLTEKQKILPYGFHIPFIDKSSWGGYCVNYLLQLLLTINVSSGDMGSDCIYVIMMMSSFTQIDLILSSLRNVDRRIQDEDVEVQKIIEEIIEKHQEHLK